MPGSISGAGAYTPDWANLISHDPGLMQTLASLQGGSAADAAGRDAAFQHALVSFGEVPDLNALAHQLGLSQADVQNMLGPDIQRLAQENTSAGLSTQARLDHANHDAIRQIRNELNARGLLNSGETGHRLGEEDLSYRQAQSDARDKLLEYLNQYQQGYLQGQQQRSSTAAQAYSSAADRQFQYNPGSPGTTAILDHVDASGKAVYRGADGNLYDVNGNRYVAPAQAAPAAPAAPAATPFPSVGAETSIGRPAHEAQNSGARYV